MSPDHGGDQHLSQGFPRVSGDEPRPNASGKPTIAFSPRERG